LAQPLYFDVDLNILFYSTVETKKVRIRKMFDCGINKIYSQNYAQAYLMVKQMKKFTEK
jgi:hypothetical protein